MSEGDAGSDAGSKSGDAVHANAVDQVFRSVQTRWAQTVALFSLNLFANTGTLFLTQDSSSFLAVVNADATSSGGDRDLDILAVKVVFIAAMFVLMNFACMISLLRQCSELRVYSKHLVTVLGQAHNEEFRNSLIKAFPAKAAARGALLQAFACVVLATIWVFQPICDVVKQPWWGVGAGVVVFLFGNALCFRYRDLVLNTQSGDANAGNRVS